MHTILWSIFPIVVLLVLRLDFALSVFVPLNDDFSTVSQNECPLSCQNGAICVDKNKFKNKYFLVADEQARKEENPVWECVCPEGYDGRLCEQRRHRQLASTTCGELECLNNGKCMDGHLDYWPDHDKPICDCSSAWSLVGSGDSLKIEQFVGRTCQIAVVAKDYCKNEQNDPNGFIDSFCVNGGNCRNQAVDGDKSPCKCPEGFKGRHCEYKAEEVQPECLLDCNGVGKCMHGANPYSDKGANGILDLANADGNGAERYMYCACDENYAGTNCEYEYTKCGGYKHYCFHGSTCKEGDNGEKECECELSGSIRVTGDACEFRATDNCLNPDTATMVHDKANEMTINDIPFCVNNGRCVHGDSKSVYYCECDGAKWSGKRCESKIVPSIAPHESPAPSVQGTDTAPPTIQSSVTEWPSLSPTWISSETWSPSPVVITREEPEPKRTSSSVKESAVDDDGRDLPGRAKFGIVVFSFALAFTVGIVGFRYYQRAHHGKERDLSRRMEPTNLQLDMISEESSTDDRFSTVRFSTVDLNAPPSPLTPAGGRSDQNFV